MGTFKNFTELDCWKHAQKLMVQVNSLIKENEGVNRNYSLRDQLFRATMSISNNIAEGFGRHSNKEFLRFLNIAQGSANEVESMIYTLHTTELITEENKDDLLQTLISVKSTTGGLMRYLSKNLERKRN